MTLKQKCLNLAYQWLNDKKIPQIKKGMVEDLEQFILSYVAEEETKKTAQRMVEKQPKEKVNEQENS